MSDQRLEGSLERFWRHAPSGRSMTQISAPDTWLPSL
jgi:hypothetical protein